MQKNFNYNEIIATKKVVLMLSSQIHAFSPINRTNRCYLQGPQHICADKAAVLKVSWERTDLHVCSLTVHMLTRCFQKALNWPRSENPGCGSGCIFWVYLQSMCLRNSHVKKKNFKERIAGWRASSLPVTLLFSSFPIWVLSSYHVLTNQNKGNMRHD